MAVLTFLFFLAVSPTETVHGIVLDPAGAAVAGARIEVYGAGLARSTFANDAGMFLIEDAPAGAY